MTKEKCLISPLRRQPFTVHDKFTNRFFNRIGVWRSSSNDVVNHLADRTSIVDFLTEVPSGIGRDGVVRIRAQGESPRGDKISRYVCAICIYPGLFVATQITSADGAVEWPTGKYRRDCVERISLKRIMKDSSSQKQIQLQCRCYRFIFLFK